jgi:hypothetical protein
MVIRTYLPAAGVLEIDGSAAVEADSGARDLVVFSRAREPTVSVDLAGRARCRGGEKDLLVGEGRTLPRLGVARRERPRRGRRPVRDCQGGEAVPEGNRKTLRLLGGESTERVGVGECAEKLSN